ncbi:phosphotransferase [Microbacterium sp. NPDC089318]
MSEGSRRERAQKQDLAALIRDSQSSLTPGRWRLLDMSTAYLERTPRDLIREVTAALARAPGARRKALALRRLFTAPRSVTTASAGPSADLGEPALSLDRLVVTKDRGLIAFDPAGAKVVHLRRTPFAVHYRQRRIALAETYPMLSWRLSADSRVLIEGRAPGEALAHWSAPDKIALVRTVLRAVSGAVARGDEEGPLIDADAGDLLDLLRGWGEGSRWHDALRTSRESASVPWVLAHGDLTPENIIGWGPEDWTPIDFEDARPAPFFFDPVSLIVRDRQLRSGALSGAFHAEWDALLAAASIEPRALSLPVAMDMVALGAAMHHHRSHGGDFRYTLTSLSS